jgi:hypothetical protein
MALQKLSGLFRICPDLWAHQASESVGAAIDERCAKETVNAS